MANTKDQDVWLRCRMTVGRAASTEDCEIHGMDAEDQTRVRLDGTTSHSRRESQTRRLGLEYRIKSDSGAEGTNASSADGV